MRAFSSPLSVITIAAMLAGCATNEPLLGPRSGPDYRLVGQAPAAAPATPTTPATPARAAQLAPQPQPTPIRPVAESMWPAAVQAPVTDPVIAPQIMAAPTAPVFEPLPPAPAVIPQAAPAPAPVTNTLETFASVEETQAASAARVAPAALPPAPTPQVAAPSQPPLREVIAVETRREVWIMGAPPMVEDAETILRTSGFPDLKLDPTDSTTAVNAFCSGVGYQSPDILAVDRTLTSDEQALCDRNGVEFNSIGAIGGFLALKDAHVALVPNLRDAFDALQ